MILPDRKDRNPVPVNTVHFPIKDSIFMLQDLPPREVPAVFNEGTGFSGHGMV